MRIDIVSAALPPKVDGIGDYTACLAAELATRHEVRILVGQPEAAAIENVEVVPAFSAADRGSFRRVVDGVASSPPDWLILQFNQFSYGRWGLNPYVPYTMRRLRSRYPSTRLAVMYHEDFLPVKSVKSAIMSSWQRWQFRSLGRTSDLVMFSIDPWARRYRDWFPKTQVMHLPVGSSIPRVQIDRAEARTRLGIREDTVVFGIFGTAHASRMLGLVSRTAHAARDAGHDVLVLYVGPHGTEVGQALGGIPAILDGPLPAEEVSRRLQAVDVYLSPYIDGVSTRRTAMMTGLQHGLCVVGTHGELTDECLREQDGRALALEGVAATDRYVSRTLALIEASGTRDQLARQAADLYEREFAWPRICDRLCLALSDRRFGAGVARHAEVSQRAV
jgi:glycosyltransferase involved in cell wall biosynthesis